MDFKKHALILAMINGLQANGAHTGKVHVMKGLGLAKLAGLLDVPFDFFLYKHGPYSTDIEQAFEEMTSYAGIKIEPALDGWGVILKPSDNANFIKQQASLSPKEQEGIQRVCRFLQGKNAKTLERIATAMWIRKEMHIGDADEVAQKLNELKQHVSVEEARVADREVVGFLDG